jgi:ribonuclease III
VTGKPAAAAIAGETLLPDLSPLEQSLGLAFRDRSTLQQAFIHRSYLHENADYVLPSNERLEFLGDAVLGFVAAEHLYQRYPELPEGDLTALRAAVVRGDALARVGLAMNLGDYLAMSRGEEAYGGRHRPLVVGRTLEALIGAIFLDQGMDTVRAFILGFLRPALEEVTTLRLDKDYKSRLQELSQGQWQVTPRYKTIRTEGPDHAREFTIQVYVGDDLVGEGSGHNKQVAQQAAARAALERWSAGDWPRGRAPLTETILKALAGILGRR